MRGCPKSVPLDKDSILVCSYGCGHRAEYLIGNKASPCCASNLYSCPAIGERKKRRVTPNLNPQILCGYGCATPARFLIGKNLTPCCTQECNACPSIQQKRVDTNISKWGTSCTLLSPEVYASSSQNMGARKPYVLPSGEVVVLQGYEPEVLSYLLSTGYKEGDFDFENRPTVSYVNPITGGTNTYHPDFWLPKENQLFEVKSTFTYARGFEVDDGVMNIIKAEAAIKQGFKFNFLVWDGGKLLDQDSLEFWKLNHRIARRRIVLNPEMGYQRHIREIYHILEPHPIVGLEDAYVTEITKGEAASVILKYEWLQTMPYVLSAAYGLKVGEELLGVVCFSPAAGATGNLCNEPVKTVCLSRGACVHYAHRNAASYLVSRACKLARKKYGWEAFIAYSDSEAGEIGTIYQACNWSYLGENLGRVSKSHYDYVSPDGSKSVTSYMLNHDKDRSILKSLGWTEGSPMRPFLRNSGWTEIEKQGKKKWVWFEGSAQRRKLLKKRLRFPVLSDGVSTPYPKRRGEVGGFLSPSVVPLSYAKRSSSKALKKAWDRRRARGDSFAFSQPIPYHGGEMCAYGCGQPAVCLIGKTKVETLCCREDYQLCPAQAAKRSLAIPQNNPSVLCAYGCNRPASFLIGAKQKPCCEEKNQRCPAQIASHKGLGGSKGKQNPARLPLGVNLKCKYGCGRDAVFVTNAKKHTLCCVPHPRSCPAFSSFHRDI